MTDLSRTRLSRDGVERRSEESVVEVSRDVQEDMDSSRWHSGSHHEVAGRSERCFRVVRPGLARLEVDRARKRGGSSDRIED